MRQRNCLGTLYKYIKAPARLKMPFTSKCKLMLRSALPYLQLIRADAPIGYWLLLWPCWLAVALTSSAIQEILELLLLFLLGAIVMRGAGCIFNDIVDRDFDAFVTRTRNRPIASGQISVIRALIFMSILSLAGLLILVQFNDTAVLIGLSSVTGENPKSHNPFFTSSGIA